MKQRFFSGSLFVLILFLVALMPGCGGGGSDTTSTDNKPTTLSVNPPNLSMEFGQVVALSASATNSGGTAVPTTFTFTSGNTAVAQVSTAGNVCAGTWDTAFVVCTPSTVPGSTTITVAGGGLTTTVPISTHRRIASVTITTTAVACTSQTKTQQFSVKAFDSTGADITSTVGTPSWSISNPEVGTFDSAGLATAKRPGSANVAAVINNVVSIPLAFTTCPPASITIKEKDSSPAVTAFTLDPAGTRTLGADVIDTLGNPITDIVLTYSSSQNSVATVTTSGIITAANPGKAGIIASCTPPTCNPGVNQPIYSNLVTVAVNGTSASTVYVTGKDSTTIVPIDTTTNVAGTAITIPTVTVNSVAVQPVVTSTMFSPDSNTLYIGTDRGLLALSAVTQTLSSPASVSGKILAISPDGSRVLVSNTTDGVIYVISPFATPSVTVETFLAPNATAAAFTPDSLKAYVIGMNQSFQSILFEVSPTFSLRSTFLSSPTNDVVVLQQGNYAYLAGDVSTTISTRATCNSALLTTVGTNPVPKVLETTFDGTHVFGTDGSNMYDISVTAGTAPCPPLAPAQALTTTSYGVASAPHQLIVPAAIAKTYLTNSTPQLLVYQPGVGASTINLAAGTTASTTGGATLDGKSVYVGALGTNDVQKVDTATGLVIQIPVSLKDKNNAATTPDFVAVRPK